MWRRTSDDCNTDGFSSTRPRLVDFLIRSSHELKVSPIVKYTSLSLFADRFYFSLSRPEKYGKLATATCEREQSTVVCASIWISSKIHESCPFSVQILKYLGDISIDEQHFTTHDFLEAVTLINYNQDVLCVNSTERVEIFIHDKVLNFEIGVGNIAFVLLEELLVQFKELAKVGELVNSESCMDIMDLLYEKEDTKILYSARTLAASILVASYIITAPKQRWEFLVLPWVKFATSCKEEDIVDTVRDFLRNVLAPY